MIRFNAGALVEVTNALKNIQGMVRSLEGKAFHMLLQGAEVQHVERALAACQAAGLESSETLAKRIISECTTRPVPTLGEFADRLGTLLERMQDDLEKVVVLRLPAGRRDYFMQPRLFGDAVAAAFPSAMVDVEEAGTCYATGRNAAAVFHLVRVMEVALRTIGHDVGASEHNPTWNAVLDKVSARLRLPYDKGGWPSVERQRYADADAILRAVQLAWRNPGMHVDRTYEDAKAKQILEAVQHFVQHLATWLRESPEPDTL